jgi:hypothetical protein
VLRTAKLCFISLPLYGSRHTRRLNSGGNPLGVARLRLVRRRRKPLRNNQLQARACLFGKNLGPVLSSGSQWQWHHRSPQAHV